MPPKEAKESKTARLAALKLDIASLNQELRERDFKCQTWMRMRQAMALHILENGRTDGRIRVHEWLGDMIDRSRAEDAEALVKRKGLEVEIWKIREKFEQDKNELRKLQKDIKGVLEVQMQKLQEEVEEMGGKEKDECWKENIAVLRS
jgi:hypothetical protein